MRMKVTIFGIIGLLILSTAIVFAQAKHRGLEYKRETLFETKPWVAPFYLPLQYGQNSYHFVHKETGRLAIRESGQDTALSPMAPIVDYFWVLNSGKLVFIDMNQRIMKPGTISVLDYQNDGWTDYLICEDYHDYFANIWTGPNDELYFNYYSLKEPANADGSRFHLRKYDLNKSNWITQPDYKPIELQGPDEVVRVISSGDIYLKINPLIYPDHPFSSNIYDYRGNFIGLKPAEGITGNGVAFNFSAGAPETTDVRSIFEIDHSGLLLERFGGLTGTEFDYRATFDSLLIIFYNHTMDEYSEDGKYFPINMPSVVIFNPRDGQTYEIKLADSLITGYKYYNVSDIAVNFKGEIYTLFVYFDNPYRITGSELIVLYRWKRS